MQKDKIKKGIHDLRSLRLSDDEMGMIYTKITNKEYTPTLLRSPQALFIRSTFFVKQSWPSILTMAVIALMLCSGGIAYATESTLPGDMLYPLKTEVLEPMGTNFAFTTATKAYMEQLKIDRRLREAARLASEGRLTEKLNSEIQERIHQSGKKLVKLMTN